MSIATTKVICSKFSPNQSKTGRHCFSKSSSAKARRASAKATSKRSSKQSSANKLRAEIYRRIDHAVLPKTRPDAAEASHLVPPRRRWTRLQKRRHLLRTRRDDRRLQRSFLDHVSPSSADARAQCEAPQVRRVKKSYRQSAATSSSQDREHTAQR